MKKGAKRIRNTTVVLASGIVVEKDEDGCYVASVPGLPDCHTQAKTLDKAMERIKEAMQAYLEAGGPKNLPRMSVKVFLVKF